jgi:hypothetical protein
MSVVYYVFPITSNIRLDGGCAADDGRSASSRLRLLPPLFGPAPLLAEDMLERSGGELCVAESC